MDRIKNEIELQKIAIQLFKQYWNDALDIQIKVNPRMYKWSARYFTLDRIEISKFAFDNYEPYGLIDLLKHELTHHACCKQGKPYKDNNEYFENELKRVEASSHRDSNETLLNKGYKIRIK